MAIGYVRTGDDCLEKDPNRRVRESIQGVFDKFRETGSARQTFTVVPAGKDPASSTPVQPLGMGDALESFPSITRS